MAKATGESRAPRRQSQKPYFPPLVLGLFLLAYGLVGEFRGWLSEVGLSPTWFCLIMGLLLLTCWVRSLWVDRIHAQRINRLVDQRTDELASVTKTMEDRRERLFQQQATLVALTQSNLFQEQSIELMLRSMLRESSVALQVERVSVWLFTENRSAILCQQQYELQRDLFTAGAQLDVSEAPRYFAALATTRLIVADDAQLDEQTRELAPNYLIPLGIRSMLDVPIFLKGELAGVLCHEHVGRLRNWTAEEQLFGTAIANLVSLAFEQAERRRSEAVLRDSEERYRLLADSTEALVSLEDPDGWKLYLSPSHVRATGHSLETLLTSDFSRWIDPNDVEIVKKTRQANLRGERTRIEFRFKTWDGSTIWLEQEARPIVEPDGRITRILCAARDVTERKRHEEELAEAIQAAESANRAKSEFLSRMSHELRTPLNAILGFAQLLELDVTTPDQRESVQHILKGGRHLLDLINEILDISRIDTGRIRYAPEPVSVVETVQETMELVRPLAQQNQVNLQADLSDRDANLLVWADRQRLKQVLLNLLSNAIKYNRAGGKVTVSAEPRANGRLGISVTDSGKGIPPDKLTRLFIPFDRLGAEQTGIEGTGLGLALSKRFIEMMNGSLEVHSEVNVGTRVQIELDKVEDSVGSRIYRGASSTGSADGTTADSRSILYIDQNPSHLRKIEQILMQRPDVRLLTAVQGRLGLELARQHVPQLIVLDLDLPDLAGEEILEQFQKEERTGSIPIVALASDAWSPQWTSLRKAGILEILRKPLEASQFLKIVDYYLGKESSPTQSRRVILAASLTKNG